MSIEPIAEPAPTAAWTVNARVLDNGVCHAAFDGRGQLYAPAVGGVRCDWLSRSTSTRARAVVPVPVRVPGPRRGHDRGPQDSGERMRLARLATGAYCGPTMIKVEQGATLIADGLCRQAVRSDGDAGLRVALAGSRPRRAKSRWLMQPFFLTDDGRTSEAFAVYRQACEATNTPAEIREPMRAELEGALR